MVDVREHWQVWAQLCFSRSGACRASGVQEWPGAAAAVTPGISFPDKPARGNVEVAGSRRPAGETCGGRLCGDWGKFPRDAMLCSALLPPYAGALGLLSGETGRRSTPSRPHPSAFSRIVSHPYTYISDPSRPAVVGVIDALTSAWDGQLGAGLVGSRRIPSSCPVANLFFFFPCSRMRVADSGAATWDLTRYIGPVRPQTSVGERPTLPTFNLSGLSFVVLVLAVGAWSPPKRHV